MHIWIYRTAPKGIGLPPNIVVDTKTYGALRPGTAYTIDVVPGKHEVMLAYFKDKVELVLTAGEDTFVRFDTDPALFGRGFTRFSWCGRLLRLNFTNIRAPTSAAPGTDLRID